MNADDFASSIGLDIDPNGNQAASEEIAEKFKETLIKSSLAAEESKHKFLIQTLVTQGEDGRVYYGTCVSGGFPIEMFDLVMRSAMEALRSNSKMNGRHPVTPHLLHVVAVAQPPAANQGTPGLTPKPEPTK